MHERLALTTILVVGCGDSTATAGERSDSASGSSTSGTLGNGSSGEGGTTSSGSGGATTGTSGTTGEGESTRGTGSSGGSESSSSGTSSTSSGGESSTGDTTGLAECDEPLLLDPLADSTASLIILSRIPFVPPMTKTGLNETVRYRINGCPYGGLEFANTVQTNLTFDSEDPITVTVLDEDENLLYTAAPVPLQFGHATVLAFSGSPENPQTADYALPLQAPPAMTDDVLFVNLHDTGEHLALEGAETSLGPWSGLTEVPYGGFSHLELPFSIVDEHPEPPWGPVLGVGTWLRWPPLNEARTGPLLSPLSPHEGGCGGWEATYVQVYAVYSDTSTGSFSYCFTP